MHPTLPFGDRSIAGLGIIEDILKSGSEGDFQYTYKGLMKWCSFKKLVHPVNEYL